MATLNFKRIQRSLVFRDQLLIPSYKFVGTRQSLINAPHRGILSRARTRAKLRCLLLIHIDWGSHWTILLTRIMQPMLADVA